MTSNQEPSVILRPRPACPENDALFLDFDGTLVDIASTPSAVRPHRRLPLLLSRLHALFAGCVVVVSGRPLSQLDQFLGPLGNAAGIHGAQLRRNGHDVPSSGHRSVASEFAAILSEAPDGLRVEDKGSAVALHFREVPQLAGTAERLARNVAAASRGSLVVQPGNMVFEIKPAGTNKGTAVETFLALDGFRGRRPIFVGDDLTDESGFEAARRSGGFGVIVRERRATAASFRLEGVGDVLEWLEEAIAGANA